MKKYHTTRRYGLYILSAAFYSALPYFAIAADTPSRLHIQENSLQTLRFRVTVPDPIFTQQNVDEQVYDIMQLEGFVLQHDLGETALPVRSFTIILPPTGNFQLRYSTILGQRVSGKNLLPARQAKIDLAGDSGRYEFSQRKSTTAPQPVRLVETGWWRGYRLGRVEIIPLQISENAAQFFSDVEVQIDFSVPPNAAPQALVPLTKIESLVLKETLNFPIAQPWRKNFTARNLQPSWPNAIASPAVKIAIEDDGFYNISYRLLDSLGLSPSPLNPATFQIWQQGREIPLQLFDDGDNQFEPDETLGFFGEGLRGETSYHNHFTKQNIYWLTFNGTSGQRFARRAVAATRDPAPPTANNFWERLHFEEEKEYYFGDNDTQIFTSVTTPGETWIWQKLRGGELFQTNVVLPNAVLTNAPSCSLRARLRGTTVDPVSPSHHVRFIINNNPVGEVLFDDTEEISFRAAFPGAWLREENNIFQIRSIDDTGAQINQIYIDWFEMGYWRQYLANDNQLTFREPQNSSGAETLYKIDNFISNDILLFDRRQQQKLEGFSFTPTAVNRFQIAFVDSTKSNRDYAALTREAFRTPAKIWVDSPANLQASNNAADYILITPAEFRAAAQRLAEYRRQRRGRQAKDRFENLRAAVVDIEDIYDEFSFGIPHPEAVQKFLRHAYENWQSPAPSFVCFLGDASLDPNFYEAGSYKRNFIFTFGNPASDNRLACFDGPEDFLPEMIAGRLPAETLAQANALVDKIIFYENAGLAEWNKTFVFLNGGVNSFEQSTFRSQSEALINGHVLANPISGRPVRIYKTTPDRTIGELRPEILSAIDAGALMLTFSGHAGTQTWELMFFNADIAELRNHEVYPFIASMTCHTARFANSNQESFGEDFLRPRDKGAIAFWGTSGFGFSFQDGVLLDSLFASLSRDTVRYVGVATTLAKIGLWKALGNAPINVNTIDQYTLLGDPAMQLALATAPDLSMTADNIRVSPSAPTEDEVQVQVSAKVRNFGLATTDSVDVEITITAVENNAEKFRQQTKLGPIGYADSASGYWLSRGSRGDFRMQSAVDRGQKIIEENKKNNSAERTIFFAPSSATLAAPLRFALLKDNRPRLSVYSPSAVTQKSRSYFFEIDTSADFNSSLKVVSPPVPEERLRTSWQVLALLRDRLYFWRSRMQEGAWQVASFSIDAQTPHSGFRQSGAQWREGIFVKTIFFNSGVTLASGQKEGTFLSPEIGPAKAWQGASGKWQMESGSLQFAIFGRSALSSAWQTLKKDLSTPEISLADIDATQFPFLRLQATFRDDDGLDAPILTEWSVEFAPRSDFATGPQVASVSADSILEGEKVRFTAEVFHFNNAAPASAENVRAIISQLDPRAARGRRQLATFALTLVPESSQSFSFDWNSAGSRGENVFFVEVDPENQLVEPVEFNNAATLAVYVKTDQAKPQLEVTFDDQAVIDGDYVSSTPTILCKIFDNSSLPIADTSRVQVLLQEQRVAYANAEVLQLESFPNGPVRAQVTYRPRLIGGEHMIEFVVRDASNNFTYYRAEVKVDTEFHLREVMNYPNPFREATEFTYYLTQPADEVRIKIFTLSGRLIATLDHAPANAGFNRVPWNGRDADGDILANGVYLYKLTAKSGEKKLEEIQKCVVLR